VTSSRSPTWTQQEDAWTDGPSQHAAVKQIVYSVNHVIRICVN